MHIGVQSDIRTHHANTGAEPYQSQRNADDEKNFIHGFISIEVVQVQQQGGNLSHQTAETEEHMQETDYR